MFNGTYKMKKFDAISFVHKMCGVLISCFILPVDFYSLQLSEKIWTFF